MSEYIDRKTLLKDVAKIGGNPWSEWETAGVFNIIRKQPIIDAVPVVRCEDCVNWDREQTIGSNNIMAPCSVWSAPETDCTTYTPVDGFCHHGERRDDHE